MNKHVRLTQLDGKLPNLALMRLAHWHRECGDKVYFSRSSECGLFENKYDYVYGSAIFTSSAHRIAELKANFPQALVGGTGSGSTMTLEDLNQSIPEQYDYSLYPDYTHSIGFLTRGCRLRCKFCVVPGKEGKPSENMKVQDLWRGEPYPKNLHLLDNDFFGLPAWRGHLEDIRSAQFRVCLSQGINVRLITEEAAAALASIEYRDAKFERRRLYTAWDNLRDERVFFRGIDRLEKSGIPPRYVLAYMLIGYDPEETWERIHYRFDKMVSRGIMPYPMPYDQSRKDLKDFQRWVVRRLYQFVPFCEYKQRRRGYAQHA